MLFSLAGSLAVSVTDMTAPVVGSSGGVYALVSAHLANVVMVIKKLVYILIMAVCAVVNMFYSKKCILFSINF